MNKSIVFAAGVLAAWGSAAQAEELGRVISSTPVVQQVAVPRQVCANQPMVVQQPSTGAGALIGGIAGGAIGNQIGHGSGRAAATALGLIGGALLGNTVESRGQQQVQNVPQCTTQTAYESRTTAYDVRYEYAGREYDVQLPYDPGPTIRLQVSPVGAMGPDAGYENPATGVRPETYAAPQPAVVAQPQRAVVAQPGVVAPAPASAYPAYPYPYPAPAYYPSYPPIGISLGFGFSNHRHGWR
jgi:uncharacterized protein YcfJ